MGSCISKIRGTSAKNSEQGRTEFARTGRTVRSQPQSSVPLLGPLRQRPQARDDTTHARTAVCEESEVLKPTEPDAISVLPDEIKLEFINELRKSNVPALLAFGSTSRYWNNFIFGEPVEEPFNRRLLEAAIDAVQVSGSIHGGRWLHFLSPNEQKKYVDTAIREYRGGTCIGGFEEIGAHMACLSDDQISEMVNAVIKASWFTNQNLGAKAVVVGMAQLTSRQRWAMVRYVAERISDVDPELRRLLAAQFKHLDVDQRTCLFKAAYDRCTEKKQADALADLGPGASYLTKEQCDSAIKELFSVDDEAQLVDAASFVAHMSSLTEDQSKLIVDVFTEIKSDRHRAETLAALAPAFALFSEDQRRRLFESGAPSNGFFWWETAAMAGVAAGMAHLTEHQRSVILDFMERVPGWDPQTDVGCAVSAQMKYLTADEQARVVGTAVKRPNVLHSVWPHMADLSADSRRLILAETDKIDWGWHELQYVAPVMAYLNDTQREKIVKAIECLPNDRTAAVLKKFRPAMPHLSIEQRWRILEKALAIDDTTLLVKERMKAEALVGLAIGDIE